MINSILLLIKFKLVFSLKVSKQMWDRWSINFTLMSIVLEFWSHHIFLQNANLVDPRTFKK